MSKQRIQNMLASTGIRINGNRPWDIQVLDERLYGRIFRQGSLGFENKWDTLKDNYTDPFYRMWKYYLLSCAGAFRSRKIQLWQITLSKNGLEGGFKTSPRHNSVLEKISNNDFIERSVSDKQGRSF